MKIKKLGIIGFFYVYTIFSSVDKNWFDIFPNHNLGISQLKIIAVLPKDSVHVVFVKDQFDTIFIVKQYKKFKTRKYLYMAMERLSSFVAQEMNFPFNLVRIIPDWVDLHGKYLKKYPATLHKKVSGVEIGKISKKSKFHDLNLRQQCGKKIPLNKSGLTRNIISHLGKHPDLPVIVGHDTFMSDKGRHRRNYLYDEKTDRFYAIDLEKCYRFNLPYRAYEHIKKMKKPFLPIELRGLRQYKETIEKLIAKFPPERIIDLFERFCKQAFSAEVFAHKKTKKHIADYKYMMEESYEYAVKLVAFLKNLLG